MLIIDGFTRESKLEIFFKKRVFFANRLFAVNQLVFNELPIELELLHENRTKLFMHAELKNW